MTTSATGNSSSSFTNRNRVAGLVSSKGGFNAQGIVESLMAIERRPYDELDIKRQTEQLRLQAYQAVNTYLLNFRNSVSTLSSRTLWNSKTTTSTNEKSLTATANEYAVKGSYSFKVAQVAAATEYASKVFADPKAAISPPKKIPDPKDSSKTIDGPPEKLGTIKLASAKTRVDNSAKLETLNGGSGVFRGSIRITDSANGTANIDLSTAITLDDVVRTINSASGIRINASMRDGKLFIEDEAGGTSTLKIQNVGAGTTATDLGIAGTSKILYDEDGVTPLLDDAGKQRQALHGRNVYTLGRDLSLDLLNDGLGVEEGNIGLRIYGKDADNNDSYYELIVNLDGTKTVGDVMDRVNAEIEDMRENGTIDPPGYGDPKELLKNLRFGVSSDGTSFGFTGVAEGRSYQFLDLNNAALVGQMTPAAQLGLTGGVQSVGAGEREVSFGRVLGDANSPMLKNLGGAAGLGIGSYPSDSRVPVPFNRDTKISALNGGRGLDTSTGFNFMLLEGGTDADGIAISDDAVIISDAVNMVEFRQWLEDNPDATLEDLVEKLNTEISAYAADPENNAAGLKGLHLSIDEQMERIIIDGVQAGYSLQIAGGLAQSLGLSRAKNGSADSTIQLDPEQSEREAALRDAIDKFYGMGDYRDALSTSVNEILLEGDPDADPPTEATTLGDLDALLANGSIADLFGAGEGFTIRVGDLVNNNGTPDDPSDDTMAHDYDPLDGDANILPGEPMEITVNWSDLTDENGDPLAIDENTDVSVLIDAMNRAIKDKFASTDQNFPNEVFYEGNVPQVRLNSLANGLQWSNMDFSSYWEMEGVGSGGALAAMNLEHGFADTRAITEGTHLASASAYKLNPMETGYVEELEVNAESAATITIGQLNYGVGITLNGEDTDTFEIEFKAPTNGEDGEYDGKKVSFTMKELREAVAAKVAELGKADMNELTLNEYMGVLNGLVDKKIDEYYEDNEPGVAAEDRFSMDFKVADGKFVVDGIENAEGLSITGNAVDYPYGTRSGIAPIKYDKAALDKLLDAGTEIPVNYVKAGTLYPQDIEGLGEIFFTLDGDDSFDKIFKLDTKGLDQDSTLNDLINHLNDQLAKMGSDSTHPQYNELLRDVRFKLNDAGTGIAVDNGSNARMTFIDSFQLKDEYEADGVTLKPADDRKRIPDAQRLAQDLGLIGPKGDENASRTVEAYSYHNAQSLGRNYVSRATSLEQFIGKNVVDMGAIRLTNAGGTSISVDLNGTKTLGDIIDKINSYQFGVVAQINAAGDGIDIIEAYPEGQVPPFEDRQGEIGIADISGGISIAKKLGIAGTGSRSAETNYNSVFRGSLSTTIDVMSTDSLEDIMYRISEAGYKTSIVNDGTGSSLVVSASNTGEKYDFVIESDVPQLGFNQVKRGKDAKVLYGDPDSSGSPRMLSSETNSNSNAILGLTLDIQSASTEWTTITVDDDKEAVTEAVKSMVTAYNELSEIIKMLDAYDQETGEEGILFGDSAVRGLMDDINEFFYDVYNPDNVPLGSLDSDGKQRTWTWMDLGITLSAAPSNADGTGGWYNQIDLDEDMLTNMVSSNWDVLSKMLSNERNVSSVHGSEESTRPTGSFNGDLAEGFSVDGAINGDTSRSAFGTTNGIMGADTIENGDNAYTIWFQKATTISRMSLFHESGETSLKNFTVEYLNSSTGQWEELRNVEDNSSEANYFGFDQLPTADAIRITAKDTNAADGKFRLLDVQIFEQTGLAGRMNEHTDELGDTQFGFLKTMNDEIQANLKDIEDQMMRLEEKLTAKEESLWRRFTAMETAMGKLQGQSDYFDNMMKSLNGSSS